MSLLISEVNFQQDVLDSPIPVLVNFWAPWCGVCKLINPSLDQLQTKLQTQLKIVSINADDNLRLANAYRLTTLPTLIVISQAKVCHRIEGFQGREALETLLEHAVQACLKPVMV